MQSIAMATGIYSASILMYQALRIISQWEYGRVGTPFSSSCWSVTSTGPPFYGNRLKGKKRKLSKESSTWHGAHGMLQALGGPGWAVHIFLRFGTARCTWTVGHGPDWRWTFRFHRNPLAFLVFSVHSLLSTSWSSSYLFFMTKLEGECYSLFASGNSEVRRREIP